MASRVRTQVFDELTVSSTYLQYGTGWIGGSRTFLAQLPLGSFREMHDLTNPGFFKAKREGSLLPVAPMSKWETLVSFEPASATHVLSFPLNGRPGGQVTTVAGALFQPQSWKDCLNLNVAPPTPAQSSESLLQEALANAQTDAWDTLTFAAEFGKTVEMLATFRGRWIQHYERVMDIARSKRQRYKSFADAVTAAWLELRYGFRPLYYDMKSIEESVDRLRKGIENPLVRGWASATGGTTSAFASRSAPDLTTLVKGGPRSNAPEIGVQTSGIGTYDVFSRERVVEQRATAGVQVTLRDVTMTDPILTAYELVSLSFVWDWFITLGEALAAFSPFASGDLRYATYTETVIDKFVLDFHPMKPRPSQGHTASFDSTSGRLTMESRHTVRSVRSVTPTLEFRFDLNVAKIVDLVALMFAMKLRHLKILNRR